ncbi:hypothetical protein [Algoriphagus litoralis]|uniref:hypothetical protein n=1 Tax=Algoriphagus litoralis TaxID=2202829 RepID=UPI000DB93712|nr:hypothetical protein [Algoriphagus litoralis]
MKKSLVVLSLLLGVVVFTGCSSDAEDQPSVQEGYIRFKSDGVSREFIPGPFDRMGFSFDANGSIFNAGVQVLGPGSTGTSNFIQFTIRNESPFAEGVDYDMQDAILYQGVPVTRILFTYSDEEGQLYNAVLLEENFPLLVVKDNAIFRFTSITDEWVEGTFSALLTGPVTNLSVGNQERRLTEGQFRMKLLDQTP